MTAAVPRDCPHGYLYRKRIGECAACTEEQLEATEHALDRVTTERDALLLLAATPHLGGFRSWQQAAVASLCVLVILALAAVGAGAVWRALS